MSLDADKRDALVVRVSRIVALGSKETAIRMISINPKAMMKRVRKVVKAAIANIDGVDRKELIQFLYDLSAGIGLTHVPQAILDSISSDWKMEPKVFFMFAASAADWDDDDDDDADEKDPDWADIFKTSSGGGTTP